MGHFTAHVSLSWEEGFWVRGGRGFSPSWFSPSQDALGWRVGTCFVASWGRFPMHHGIGTPCGQKDRQTEETTFPHPSDAGDKKEL